LGRHVGEGGDLDVKVVDGDFSVLVSNIQGVEFNSNSVKLSG
jgi:hypothetical protein